MQTTNSFANLLIVNGVIKLAEEKKHKFLYKKEEKKKEKKIETYGISTSMREALRKGEVIA